MRKSFLYASAIAALLFSTGCSPSSEKEKPTFMFWCFRQEVVSSDYLIPDLKTPQDAAVIQRAIKSIPGYVDSHVDFESHTLSIRYKSSVVRKMNFEEAIAMAGYKVNFRPAMKKSAVRRK